MKKRITQDDYIKANRKASREEEIESHGHPVSYKRVHQSKKVYNRKRRKVEDKALPFFVSGRNALFFAIATTSRIIIVTNSETENQVKCDNHKSLSQEIYVHSGR